MIKDFPTQFNLLYLSMKDDTVDPGSGFCICSKIYNFLNALNMYVVIYVVIRVHNYLVIPTKFKYLLYKFLVNLVPYYT